MRILDALTAGYVLGLLIEALPDGGIAYEAWLVSGGFLLAVTFWRFRRGAWALGCVLASLGLVAAMVVPALYRWSVPSHHLLRHIPTEPANLIGHLSQPVERREEKQPRLYIDAERALIRGVEVPIEGKVRVRLASEIADALEVGDRILVRRVRLQPPHRYQNPGGFDYREFLRLRGVHAVGFVSGRSVERLASRERGAWRRTLFHFREGMQAHLERALPAEAAGLLESMVIGAREGLDEETRSAFQTAGTAHLLAISGLHVGFIAAFFFFVFRALFRRLPQRLFPIQPVVITPDKTASMAAIPIVVLFTLLTGARVSTVRACIMAVAYLSARVLERPGRALHSVLLAAFLILLVEPAFIWDAGFQLSFVAVVAIILAAKRLPRPEPGQKPWESGWWRIRIVQLACVQVVVTAAVAPLTALHFHEAHPLGIVANFALVPLASLAVPVAFLVSSFASVVTLLGIAGMDWALWPFDAFLALVSRLMIFLSKAAAAVPGATLTVPPPTLWLVALIFTSLLVALAVRQLRWRRTGWAGVALGFALMVFPRSVLSPTSGEQSVLLLPDAGSTDAFFLRLPGGRGVAVDGSGRSERGFNPWENVLLPLLLRQGETSWDLLVAFSSRDAKSLASRALVPGLRIGRFVRAKALGADGTPGERAPRKGEVAAGAVWEMTGGGGARLSLRRGSRGGLAFELRHGAARWLLAMPAKSFDLSLLSGEGYDLVRLPDRHLRQEKVLERLERLRPGLVVASPHRGAWLPRERWRRVRARQEKLGVYRSWWSGMMRVRTNGAPVGRGASVERFEMAASWPQARPGRWVAHGPLPDSAGREAGESSSAGERP